MMSSLIKGTGDGQRKELYTKREKAVQLHGQRIQGSHMVYNGQKAYVNKNKNRTQVVTEHTHTDRIYMQHSNTVCGTEEIVCRYGHGHGHGHSPTVTVTVTITVNVPTPADSGPGVISPSAILMSEH
jgi:hypothetical protein